MKTRGLRKNGFQHSNSQGEIRFFGYVTLLDNQRFIQCSYLPFVFRELKTHFLEAHMYTFTLKP